MTDRKTHDVFVHKAAVPLMKGESIGAFTGALRDAGKAHLLQKFNVDDKKGGAFPIEVFASKAVFTVVPDFQKSSSNDFHVAMKFTRSTDTGQFTFTDTMKVQPVTSFVPSADGVAVNKAMDLDAWAPAPSTFAGVI
jgi:hypothetical protein